MFGINNRMVLALLIGFLASSSWGCSIIVGQTGVARPGFIQNLQYKSKTQADIRDEFGEAEETRICPGEQIAESRWIRIKVGDPSLLALHAYTYGFAEIFLFPMMIYQSEKQKIHFTFVYDKAGHLLYLYDLQATPIDQFNMAIRPLAEGVYRQLNIGRCDTCSTCLTRYIKEARQRADCIGYPLDAEEEQEFEDLLSIGERVDLGQITSEEGLAAIRKTAHKRFLFPD
jgi:hypothetical protein